MYETGWQKGLKGVIHDLKTHPRVIKISDLTNFGVLNSNLKSMSRYNLQFISQFIREIANSRFPRKTQFQIVDHTLKSPDLGIRGILFLVQKVWERILFTRLLAWLKTVYFHRRSLAFILGGKGQATSQCDAGSSVEPHKSVTLDFFENVEYCIHFDRY